jgi:xylose isomerase
MAAAAMIEDGGLDAALTERYAGWDAPEAQAMLTSDLATIAERVDREGLEPEPRSGRQERLENWVNRFV